MWCDNDVTVVSCDMRAWAAPERGDILVSELLGSFGDNELSPECLDGAQKHLKGPFVGTAVVLDGSSLCCCLFFFVFFLGGGGETNDLCFEVQCETFT